jgi:hypothetical protein
VILPTLHELVPPSSSALAAAQPVLLPVTLPVSSHTELGRWAGSSLPRAVADSAFSFTSAFGSTPSWRWFFSKHEMKHIAVPYTVDLILLHFVEYPLGERDPERRKDRAVIVYLALLRPGMGSLRLE